MVQFAGALGSLSCVIIGFCKVYLTKFNFCTWICSLISALLQEVFTSLVTGWVFVSGITWVLVYRTDKYKRLKAEVEKQSKKRKYSPGACLCP